MCRKGVTDELIRAARRVAQSVKGPDRKRTESDLLKMLQAHELDVEAARTGKPLQSLDLAKIVVGMRIEKSRQRESPAPERRPGLPDHFPVPPIQSQYRPPPVLRSRPPSERTASKPLLLFGKEALNVFDASRYDLSDSGLLKTWKRLRQDELKTLVSHPPTNAFEEMILWTEQGKLWKYPIDNEDGLDEEKKVPFYEHVFTDHWMEGLPEKGPVRQFMEVIAMAMTKNPYITTTRKRETFEWFKKYFEIKHDILVRSGAL